MNDDMHTGDRVEVRRRLDAGWASGFEVVDVEDEGGGVHVRRVSDGAVLPATFVAHDVRREGPGQQFWSM